MKSALAFLRDDPRLLLFGLFLTFGSSFGQTFFISLFSGHIRADFGLSHGEFGTLYSIGTLASALVLVWSGQWLDRIDLRQWIMLLIPFFAVACLVMSLAEGALLLTLALFMLRQGGQGLMSSTALTSQARYYRTAPGRAVATAALGYQLGEGVLPFVTVFLLAHLDWRLVWQLSGYSLLIIWLPLALLLLRGHGQRHSAYLSTFNVESDQQVQREEKPKIQRQWQRKEVLRDFRFYLLLPAIMAPSFVGTGLFFHQVHLVESKGWSLALWASAFAGYAFSSFPASLLFGHWVDKVGSVKALPWFLPPLVLSCLALWLSDHSLAIWVFMIAIGVSSGFYYTLAGVFWAEVYGTLHLGSIRALTMAISVFSTAGSPILMGLALDWGISIETICLASGLYSFLAIGLTLWAQRLYGATSSATVTP